MDILVNLPPGSGEIAKNKKSVPIRFIIFTNEKEIQLVRILIEIRMNDECSLKCSGLCTFRYLM